MDSTSTSDKKAHTREVIDLTGDSDDEEDTKRPRWAESNSAGAEWAHIDTYVGQKDPTQALELAARTGNLERLLEILENFQVDVVDATMAAASNGHYGCVVALRDYLCDPEDDEYYLDIEGRETFSAAVVPAAQNGHSDVVKFILIALLSDGEINEEATWRAFHEAASHGFVDIVQMTAEQLSWRDEFDRECSPALLSAIAGGHTEVVALLLQLEDCHCDMGSAFVEAMNMTQHEVAERIYEIFPEVTGGENLFVEMAGRGRRDVVAYMYEHGHIDEKLIREALQRASANACTSVVGFLKTLRATTL
ncbi:unnamed protein product [Phytophthora lilii]|uniref:Unnamed protein product n=1 Tax=Phytophthora lilii TaxID=2077276 RepID=A0A9W6XBG4_9STRA|nr:unnamed protein product [Phytophthora lilii]